MKVNWKRIISLVLAACLLLGLLPAQAMAYYTPAGSKPVIQTANGALEPEDDWDEVYPYGALCPGRGRIDPVRGRRGHHHPLPPGRYDRPGHGAGKI